MDLETPENWPQNLADFLAPFGAHFPRSESRTSAGHYIRGLLADVPRKNTWQLAQAVGLSDPHPLQRLLREVPWSAEAVCHDVRRLVREQIGYEPGIGVIDESGFVKKGSKSAGVGRQYCGRLGKVENCQVGVFLGYATPHGAAFLDRSLYVPEAWFADPDRCQQAGLPATLTFQTKPQLAQTMLEQAWTEGIPMQWVVGDTVYGNSPGLRQAIHATGRWYVLGIGAQHRIQLADGPRTTISDWVEDQMSAAWERLCFQMGEKGPIWYDWCAWRIQLLAEPDHEQWLLVRRATDDPSNWWGYISNAPPETSLADLAGVALTRHTIEQLLEEAKGEVGLADYEVRSWTGWYRHITLALLAHTFLKLIQLQQREKKSLTHLVVAECG